MAGGARALNGLEELSGASFHLPVRVAEPKGLADLPEQVAQPEYATVVGLVLCGAKARRPRPSVREICIKIENQCSQAPRGPCPGAVRNWRGLRKI